MTKPRAKTALAATCVAGLSACSLAFAIPASAQEDTQTEEREMTKGEQRLARMLEGRVAGEPVECIPSRPNTLVTVIDETAIVYGRGRTLYVQRTSNPEDIDRGTILVNRQFDATRFCRQDIVNTVERVTGFPRGNIFFESFIPYTRVEEDEG